MYDIVVIGAGVTGAFVARELSKYKLDVCLVEKESDVSMGSSKANSSIVHAGYNALPGSLKAKLNVYGNRIMEKTACELDVPYKRTGSLVLTFEDNDENRLTELKERGVKNGVKGQKILKREQILRMEPNVSNNVTGALYVNSAGVICPYELTIGAVENAVENGVYLRLESKVTDIKNIDGCFLIITGHSEFKCKYVVNTAGVYADSISSMIGDKSYKIQPRKGQYLLLDKDQGNLVNTVIFQMPTPKSKGIVVTPTVDGNLLIGPNAEDITDKEDNTTTFTGLDEVINGAQKAVPGINFEKVITSFAGLRAKPSSGDFIIGPSIKNSRFINAAGIESPGLSCGPATGLFVAEVLRKQGLNLQKNNKYNPFRKRVIRTRNLKQPEFNRLIKTDTRYGRIVCRCEMVSEGEIVDCIKRPAGAKNLDAVKRRTRAGMGRCQGGFCSTRIIKILSRELNMPMDKITKMGGGSKLLNGRTK